jgi:hypothetical protein
MIVLLRHLLGWLTALLRTRESLILENLALGNNCWLCTESDLAFDWVVSIGCSGFVIFHVPVDFFSGIQKLLGKPGGDL